jgi:hypothetical protein
MATKIRRDWAKLDPLIDNLKAQGWNDTQIARDLGIGRQTLVDHLRSRDTIGTPTEHPGTLEGHQEVMEEVHQSVPDAPHIGTEEIYQSTPEPPSTPEVHPEMSLDDSGVPLEHSGVSARQELQVSTPLVHPGTPSAEDWALWTAIKTQWGEVEKVLADWHTRQALLGTPIGTPKDTQKKTYVFDVRHIALIDRYAQEHRLDLKDVIYTMCEEFFQQRGYLKKHA